MLCVVDLPSGFVLFSGTVSFDFFFPLNEPCFPDSLYALLFIENWRFESSNIYGNKILFLCHGLLGFVFLCFKLWLSLC